MVAHYIRYEFTRKSLHDLVWSQPTSKIEGKLFIPVRELRRICLNFDVPRPLSGYWTKVSRGRKPAITELPISEVHEDRDVSIRVTNPAYRYPTREEDTEKLRQFVIKRANAKREKDRRKFMTKLFARHQKFLKLSSEMRQFRANRKLEEFPDLTQMIFWAETWIEDQARQLSSEGLNAQLTKSRLFDDGDADPKFDPVNWTSPFIGYFEVDSIFFEHLSSGDEYGEEVIDCRGKHSTQLKFFTDP